MKIIKILSLICFLSVSILAQTGATLEGKITLFGVAVKNTEVLLSQAANKKAIFTTRTDDNGNYRFENVPLGSYILTTTTVTLDVLTVGPVNVGLKKQETKIVNLELAARDQNLGSVSISAGAEQTIEQVSKTVDTIDAQEMRDRADFSLVESLRTIPGFRVQQLGGFGRTASIKTRGLRNQDTAVLIDGIRFRDASSITGDASAFLSDFTLTSVNKIEVLRGSGSSLYGTNAVGGVIDFQTPKPQTGFHGQASGAFGGYGLGRFRGNISDGSDKFGFNLGVSRTVYTKGIDGEDDAHNTNFQSRIEYNPFQKTNISARFFVSDAYVRLNSNPDTIGTLPPTNATIINAVPLASDLVKRIENNQPVTSTGSANFVPDLNDPDTFQKSQFFNGQIVLTQILTEKLVFQGYYSGLKTARRNVTATGVGDAASVFDGTIQTANAHLNYAPDRSNQITVGYEFEHEKFGNDGVTPFITENFFTRARQSSNTFYAQDLISLLKGNLQIAGGFRAQFFSLKDAEFSLTNAPYSNLTLENPATAYTFDGAASYFFERTGTKLRAHAGNGYRVPSLYERFGTFYSTFIAPAFVALGDPALKPEKTIAFDAGVEQNLFKNRAKLSATYFYTKLIDTIGFGNVVSSIGTTPRPFGGYLNTKGGIARGAEFSAKVRAARSTDVFASYTFTNSDQRVPQVTGNPNIATLGIPNHQFTLVATQRIGRAWVNFDFLGTSSYLAPIFDTNNFTFQTYVYRFKGNRKADLTAGYTFAFNNEKQSLRLFGTIENLFDYDYYENGFRTPGRNGRIGLSFGF
ncbi:MAG TPA: TonB-dependent receptor [Pyrinomonadaceae bacterium]